MTFADKLYRLRKEKGLSQKELAKQAGLSQTSIYYWERGERNPKLEQLQKIANVLNVPVEYLFDTINIGLSTERDLEKIDFLLSKDITDIQSILWGNGYLLTKKNDNYIIQKVVNGTHGKKILINQDEYKELTRDIDFFIKYLMDKLFNNHNYYFNDDK